MSTHEGPEASAGYDLFISAPMSALGESAYAAGRAGILALMERLSAAHGFGPIYFAGTAISDPSAFTGESGALRQDLRALRNSRLFVLIYPDKIVTSALVEAGYALALRLPCLLLVHERNDLPYLLNQAESRDGDDLLPPLRVEVYGELEHAARKIVEFRDKVVGGGQAGGR